MAICINCGKSFSCSCSMYKNKYCNDKCEKSYLEKKKNDELSSKIIIKNESENTRNIQDRK
jgi:hypothetical protein